MLEVPNTWFQEYLGEHYTEVIQEELLRKFNKHLEIEFVVPEETPQEAPTLKVEPPRPPQPSDDVQEPRTREEALGLSSRKESDPYLQRLEAEWRKDFLPEPFEPCDVAQAEQLDALEDLAWAKAREKAVDQIAKDSGDSYVYMATKKEQAKARWTAEDKLRKAEQAVRRAALVARLSPALLREPGIPQHQRQHEAPSAWATSGEANRKDIKEAERALRDDKPKGKPDSS